MPLSLDGKVFTNVSELRIALAKFDPLTPVVGEAPPYTGVELKYDGIKLAFRAPHNSKPTQ